MQNGIPYLPDSVMDHVPFDLVWWQACKSGLCTNLPAGAVPPFPAWMQMLPEVGACSEQPKGDYHCWCICTWFWAQPRAWSRKADGLGQIDADHFRHVAKGNQSSGLIGPALCTTDGQYMLYIFFFFNQCTECWARRTWRGFPKYFSHAYDELWLPQQTEIRKYTTRVFVYFNTRIKVNESLPLRTAVSYMCDQLPLEPEQTLLKAASRC